MQKTTFAFLAVAFFFTGLFQFSSDVDARRKQPPRLRKARKQCNDGAKKCEKFQSFHCVKGFWQQTGVCFDRCSDKQTVCSGGTLLICKNKLWSASEKTCAAPVNAKSSKSKRRLQMQKRGCRAACVMGLSTVCVNGNRKFTNKSCREKNKCEEKAKKCEVGKEKVCVHGSWIGSGARCLAPRVGARKKGSKKR